AGIANPHGRRGGIPVSENAAYRSLPPPSRSVSRGVQRFRGHISAGPNAFPRGGIPGNADVFDAQSPDSAVRAYSWKTFGGNPFRNSIFGNEAQGPYEPGSRNPVPQGCGHGGGALETLRKNVIRSYRSLQREPGPGSQERAHGTDPKRKAENLGGRNFRLVPSGSHLLVRWKPAGIRRAVRADGGKGHSHPAQSVQASEQLLLPLLSRRCGARGRAHLDLLPAPGGCGAHQDRKSTRL